MLGHLGFSYIGMIYLLMLFTPNLFWKKNKPNGYQELVREENRILLFFERLGQICVTCCALIFNDFNIAPFSWWSLWLIVSFVLMILYEIYWFRYFTKGHSLTDFYGSFLGIPVICGSTLRSM